MSRHLSQRLEIGDTLREETVNDSDNVPLMQSQGPGSLQTLLREDSSLRQAPCVSSQGRRGPFRVLLAPLCSVSSEGQSGATDNPTGPEAAWRPSDGERLQHCPQGQGQGGREGGNKGATFVKRELGGGTGRAGEESRKEGGEGGPDGKRRRPQGQRPYIDLR